MSSKKLREEVLCASAPAINVVALCTVDSDGGDLSNLVGQAFATIWDTGGPFSSL
jgi:hypothetical protein